MTSAAANNGSGFEGLKMIQHSGISLQESLCCFLCYIPIILQLMIASSLVNKKSYHQDKYTIAIDKPYFVAYH
ncbi:potassium-transporting ATPase subunit KdpA [Staphylococcus aureus]